MARIGRACQIFCLDIRWKSETARGGLAMEEKRPRGRPRKAPEKGERQNYTFRLHSNVREWLLKCAAAGNRTLSEEIEYRIELSMKQQQEWQMEREDLTRVYDRMYKEQRTHFKAIFAQLE